MTKAKRGQLIVVETTHTYFSLKEGQASYKTYEAMVARKVNRLGVVVEASNRRSSPVKIGREHTVLVVPADKMNQCGARYVIDRLDESYETLSDIRSAMVSVLYDIPMRADIATVEG